ncbi:MAG: hypothetical protein ACE37B_19030 [Ilumatobacter sp.]|uniref:hypothetical protein n=1 Tax=Ilumatobacter sp. TaxID=1967498 RepID=UPI003918C721
MAAGFLAALMVGAWPWVSLIGVVAGGAGCPVSSGRSRPLAIIALAVVTLPPQPEAERAAVFGVVLLLAVALGYLIAVRLPASQRVELSHRDGSRLLYAMASPSVLAVRPVWRWGGSAPLGSS